MGCFNLDSSVMVNNPRTNKKKLHKIDVKSPDKSINLEKKIFIQKIRLENAKL